MQAGRQAGRQVNTTREQKANIGFGREKGFVEGGYYEL
jgi:hypothetical protein